MLECRVGNSAALAEQSGIGGNGLDKNERNDRREDLILPENRDSRIQVVVNQQQDDSAMEIDLVRVFRNMKRKLHLYAWVMLLFFVIGLCAPLLLYQFNRKPLTVSSVVTLDYNVVERNSDGEIVSSERVRNLTAPNGNSLDLNRITASNVLQAALDGLELSHPVSLTQLRDNIRIERILSKDSRRQQEIASSMIQSKNSGAYSQVQSISLTYTNQFVVSLTNGFGSKGSELTDAELRLGLERVLSAYNDYLADTYADIRLPDDEFSSIDIEKQDVLESLDLLRSAVQDLYDFCAARSSSIRSYHSWNTGATLNDLMRELQTARSVNVDYLYAYVSSNSIVRDRDSMITSYRYQMRRAQTTLDALNENVATIRDILSNYQNDQIFVAGQEEDAARSISTTTDYYNRLIMEQANTYDRIARQEELIADLQYKLDMLNTAEAESIGAEEREAILEELSEALRVCKAIYAKILAQLEEIYTSSFFSDYADHTAPQGQTAGFLSAAAKKMVIGGAAGLVIACGLWFLSALALEFRSKEQEEPRKETAKQ